MGKSALVVIVLTIVVAACSSLPDEDSGEPEPETEAAFHQESGHGHGHGFGHRRRVRLAWLNSDPANTYDAANLAGVQEVADDDGRVSVTPFYSFFDPQLQLEQCFQTVWSFRYDAIVIIPVDAVGIIPCVQHARWLGVPVVAADLPIGPDIDTVEPQVPGQAGAVLVPPAEWGATLPPLVVDRCAGHAPCNVLYIAGSFDVVNDQVAIAALEDIATAAGINLITDQAFYDRGLAAAITDGVLAQQPAVHVIIGAGDQMAQGAEDALAARGIAPGSVPIIGAGAGAAGIAAVQDGRWYATFMALPRDEGELAADIAIRSARCQWVSDRGIDPVELRGFPPFFTRDNQHLFAGFSPQWPG